MATTLEELLQPFLNTSPQTMDVGEKRPFGYEPFDMPLRASRLDLAGYEPILETIYAYETGSSIPALEIKQRDPASDSESERLAQMGGNLTLQLAALRQHITRELKGMDSSSPDKFSTLSLPFVIGANFWEAISLIRGGQAIAVVQIHKSGLNVLVEKHAIGLQYEMSEADGYTNLLRLTTMALAATLTSCNTLLLPSHTARESPLDLETREHILHIMEHEARVDGYKAPLKGAYWPDLLAIRLIEASALLLAEIEAGTTSFELELQKTQAARAADVLSGKAVWVGQTKFENSALTIQGPVAPEYAPWKASPLT
jgi:hypothetical protein